MGAKKSTGWFPVYSINSSDCRYNYYVQADKIYDE